jgi:phage host-nuclease inhibitor protein Gam
MATKKVTEEQAQLAARSYFEASNAKNVTEAQMKLDVAEVQRNYEPDLKELNDTITEAEGIVKQYAEQERERLFVNAKSAAFGPCKIGFRSGTKKLVLGTAADWETVLANAKRLLPKYVRKVEDLEKDKVLKDAATIGDDKLAALGVAVAQDEKFFISI